MQKHPCTYNTLQTTWAVRFIFWNRELSTFHLLFFLIIAIPAFCFECSNPDTSVLFYTWAVTQSYPLHFLSNEKTLKVLMCFHTKQFQFWWIVIKYVYEMNNSHTHLELPQSTKFEFVFHNQRDFHICKSEHGKISLSSENLLHESGRVGSSAHCINIPRTCYRFAVTITQHP